MANNSLENWKLVLDFADKSKSDIIMSIRTPLYIILQGSIKTGFIRSVKHVYRSIRLFTELPRRKLCAVDANRIMVCIPSSAPSCLLNMHPVLEEALQRQVLGGILLGELEENENKKYSSAYPSVPFRTMISTVTIIQRVKILFEIFKTIKVIKKLSHKEYPKLVSSLKGKFAYLFRLVSISMLVQFSVERVLRLWKPSCIITSGDFWPFEYQVISVSKRMAVPSYIVQHGVINESWWPFVADYLLLWGKPFKEEMLLHGAPEKRLRIVGMPSTDKIFKNTKIDKEEVFKKGSLSCVIISQTSAAGIYPEVFRTFHEILDTTMAKLTDVEWRIKLHPVETGDFYNNLLKKHGANLRLLPKSTTLQDAVKESDVAITIFSTAGLEVMIMQRPLIILNLSPQLTKFVWWPSKGGGSMYPIQKHCNLKSVGF